MTSATRASPCSTARRGSSTNAVWISLHRRLKPSASRFGRRRPRSPVAASSEDVALESPAATAAESEGAAGLAGGGDAEPALDETGGDEGAVPEPEGGPAVVARSGGALELGARPARSAVVGPGGAAIDPLEPSVGSRSSASIGRSSTFVPPLTTSLIDRRSLI